MGLGKDIFKPLLNAVEKAFKKLHSNGKYKPEDLAKTAAYQNVIRETNNILSRSLKDNDLSEGILKSLQNDVFVFSGLKTHAQLFEASRQLLTKEKTIKPFETFTRDIAKIKSNYNRNYLEAEYDFAVGSVQMAERWSNFSDSERYLLQYRTANDDKVRVTHQPLHNITLPKSDTFWDKFFPPNGWRCRCTTLQVLAHTNEQSNSKEASKKGNKATTQIGKSGKNKLEIFRFNAGRQKVVFPPKHPYRKVKGATKAQAITKAIGAKASKFDENGFLEVKKYKGGGTVHIHKDINTDDRDFRHLVNSAKYFAKKRNAKVELMPILHRNSSEYKSLYAELINTKFEGKCPDLRINGKFYEHEGFTTTKPKKAVKNMLNRGLKQATSVIIEDSGVTDAYLLRNIKDRVFQFNQNIDEVWLKKGTKLKLIYKNAKTQ